MTKGKPKTKKQDDSFGAIRHHKKGAFLSAFARLGNIRRACDVATVDRQSHYNWLRDDPEYARAFETAKLDACDRLEAEARRRAVRGTVRPVFHQGVQCGGIREYSDTLLIFLLKGALPEKYSDRHKTEITGAQGKPIQVELANLRASLLHDDDYLEYQRARACDADADPRDLRADGEPVALADESPSASLGSQAD